MILLYYCPLFRLDYRFYNQDALRVQYSVTVNRNAHTLTLYKDGNVFKAYPVAIGKMLSPTPKGVYKIKAKALNPGGPYGVRWLALTIPGGGYGIHGTNNPSSIGKNVSHGCIRMYNKDVIELYNLLPIGTSVKIV
jgi:lipoprotein-anchoring transpeptidase ErfK/SrfK